MDEKEEVNLFEKEQDTMIRQISVDFAIKLNEPGAGVNSIVDDAKEIYKFLKGE